MPRNKGKKKNDQAAYIPGMGPPPQQTAPPARAAAPVRQTPAPPPDVSSDQDPGPQIQQAPGWGGQPIRRAPRQQHQQQRDVSGGQHQRHQQQPADGGEVQARASPQARPQPRQQQQTSPAKEVTKDMASLRLGSDLLPPKKRVDPELGQFPGKSGKNCQLRVNHFRMKIPTGIIYQYSVKIMPPWSRAYKKADKDIYQLVMNEWRKVNPVAKKSPLTWVFDGNSTLYCTGAYEKIPHSEISLQIEGDTEPKTFCVTDIKIDKQIMISQDLAEWAAKGQSGQSLVWSWC